MLEEVLEYIQVRPGGAYVDATVGLGGHAEAVLAHSAPNGVVVGVDIDPVALQQASQRLSHYGDRFRPIRSCFSQLAELLPHEQWDGILFDLGAGHYHYQDPSRGFSFQHDGPLDMRFDPEGETTAADLVNRLSFEELVTLFKKVGGEPFARPIARAIEQQRRLAPIRTTRELTQLIERVVPVRVGRVHPATRVFMALRIAVNREFERILKGLEAAVRLLKAGGRLCVLTFHSGEVQLVRQFARRWTADYEVVGEVDRPEFRRPRAPVMRWVVRHGIRPREQEVEANPRARSASLFVLEKVAALDGVAGS